MHYPSKLCPIPILHLPPHRRPVGFVRHAFISPPRKCVTNKPHRTSAGRLILHLHNVSWSAVLKGNTYTSTPVSVYDFLERQDRKIFRKFLNSTGHPLLSIMPRVKSSSYYLKKETCYKLKINTLRFKNSFINRISFVMYWILILTSYLFILLTRCRIS